MIFLAFTVVSLGEESFESCEVCISDDSVYINETNITNTNIGNKDEVLYYLWSETCTVCDSAKTFINEIEGKYGITIMSYEMNKDKDEFNKKFKEYNIERVGVPTLIYDGLVWQGFNEHISSEMENHISGNERNALEGLRFYRWNFKTGEYIFPTLVIGSIDGLNPCSLWALMFLIGIVLRLNSRKKMLLVGSTFIIVVAVMYGLYIIGVFGITINIMNILWLRIIMFLIAIVFAGVTIKDFFTSKGISFSISPKNKNRYTYKVENLIVKKNNNLSLIIGTSLVALFASLIELPCTAGFPIIWNSFLAQQGVTMTQYIPLLIIYLIMYVLIEIIVVIFATITLSKVEMNFKVSMAVKLISGSLILFLGILLLMGSKYINNMTLVTGGAVAVIFVSGLFSYLYTSKY